MPHLTTEVSCPLRSSFRVEQIAGMFDVPLSEKLTEKFEVELPDDDEPWDIGLIVGPSGSGKSTIARTYFADALSEHREWPRDRAIIDAFEPLGIKQTVDLLTSVGFGSPPAWIKPYEVLSGGERFRCDLARALAVGIKPFSPQEKVAEGRMRGDNEQPGVSLTQMKTNPRFAESRQAELQQPRYNPSSDREYAATFSRREKELRPTVVFDEFTSVVDRNVARFGSAAVAKAIRSGRVACRFVAVTCHYDVEPWLEADWTLDMATGKLARRRLRRPEIKLEVRRAPLDAWRLFARHHYLNGRLSWGARCYLATWNDVPAALCAVLPMFATRGRWRITRLVTLPDFQGLGIGTRLAEAVGDVYLRDGLRFGITSSHPALLAHCRRSPRWKLTRVVRCETRHRDRKKSNYRGAAGRAVASFELLPERNAA